MILQKADFCKIFVIFLTSYLIKKAKKAPDKDEEQGHSFLEAALSTSYLFSLSGNDTFFQNDVAVQSSLARLDDQISFFRLLIESKAFKFFDGCTIMILFQ